MQILIWGDNMKKQISVCIFLSVILVALSLAVIKRNNTKKEYEQAEHTKMIEDTQEFIIEHETQTDIHTQESDDMFCIFERDNRLVVYEAKTKAFYMETGIVLEDLPTDIREHLKTGIFFQNESDLYDFLESYSS